MNEILEKVTRYYCKYCKKDFKTPDRHYCKMNPKLKNCFTCKHLKGWLESEDGVDVGVGILMDPNYPDCEKELGYEWNIESIKDCNYDMKCEGWKQGEYDWTKFEYDSLPFD